MNQFLIVGILIVGLVFGPLATIWALNTLFPTLAIPFTLETWASVVIIGGVLKSRVSTK